MNQSKVDHPPLESGWTREYINRVRETTEKAMRIEWEDGSTTWIPKSVAKHQVTNGVKDVVDIINWYYDKNIAAR